MSKRTPERHAVRPTFEHVADLLIALGRRIDSPELLTFRHDDQQEYTEWHGADVHVTSDFAWEPLSFTEVHDLVVRTQGPAIQTVELCPPKWPKIDFF